MARYAEELKEAMGDVLWEKILEQEGETFITSGRGSVPKLLFSYKLLEYNMYGRR